MLIVANWKAYVEDVKLAKKLVSLARRLASQTKIHIVLAPSAPQVGFFSSSNRSKVQFSTQDISETNGGASTGEATAQIYAGMGVTYAIIGHSERRAHGETDSVIATKVQHAVAHGITPILCVGETKRDADASYLSFVRAQIATVFEPLSQKERMQMVIAYEPVWAIGKTSAEAINPNDLAEMVLYIRKVLGDYLPHKAPVNIRILYGGSVEPGNARALASASRIDGFLVGRASVNPETFSALVKAVS